MHAHRRPQVDVVLWDAHTMQHLERVWTTLDVLIVNHLFLRFCLVQVLYTNLLCVKHFCYIHLFMVLVTLPGSFQTIQLHNWELSDHSILSAVHPKTFSYGTVGKCSDTWICSDKWKFIQKLIVKITLYYADASFKKISPQSG